MKSIAIKSFVFCIAILLSGCQTSYWMYVNSINDDLLVGSLTTYALTTTNKNISTNSLQAKEFEKYIHEALKDQGFVIAKDDAPSDLIIFYDYGISDPNESVDTYQSWGKTGEVVTGATGNVNSNGDVSVNTQTKNTYGATGSYSVTTTTFDRHLNLSAINMREYRESGEMSEVWNTNVRSSGSSGDLRRVFPGLIVAIKPYIAMNTGEEKLVQFSVDSKEIKAVIEGIK